ncbi:MAG: hypothetical protein QXP83_07480 [Candidatus Nezhaarchaeales archaeon]
MELKSKLLELLEVDAEFRYAVAGRLGILELLKKLDAMELSLNRLWEEVKALREGQNKLWDSVNRLWENQTKLWEEVKKLREEQVRLWEEVKALREGQNRLWENQTKLWEGQNRLWEEVKKLREEQLKLRASFESFGKALGVTLEHYTASFIRLMLEGMGFPKAEVGRKILLYEGSLYEINIFCDEPLTIGEATLYIGDVDEARRELEKLLRRVEVAEKTTGKKTKLKILAIGNASKQALEYLKTEAEKLEVKILYGREIIT